MEDHGLAIVFTLGLLAMSIAEVAIGFMHLNDCPFEPRIPVWLVVCGFAILLRVPILAVSYCNVIVTETQLVAAAIFVFMLGAFDLGWMLHGAHLLLRRTLDDYTVPYTNSTLYCEIKISSTSYTALLINGIVSPILSCYGAINLIVDRNYENF